MTKNRILVIEDDVNSMKLFKLLLSQIDCSITYKSDGLEGLKEFEKIKPNLLILDLQIPTMNGFKILKKIRKELNNKKTPIMVVTAYAMPDDVKRVFDAGATKYLSKPIRINNFISTVKELLT